MCLLWTKWLSSLWMCGIQTRVFHYLPLNPLPAQMFLDRKLRSFFLKVASLECFDVFHLGTKSSQVLTDVLSPCMLLKGNPKSKLAF